MFCESLIIVYHYDEVSNLSCYLQLISCLGMMNCYLLSSIVILLNFIFEIHIILENDDYLSSLDLKMDVMA